MNRTFRTLLIYGLVFIAVAFIAQRWVDSTTEPEEIQLNEFLDSVAEGRVETATVFATSDRVEGRYELSESIEGANDFLVRYPAEFEGEITDALIEAGVEFDTDPEPPGFLDILFGILPWLILIGFMVFIFMQMQGSGNRVMQFGKAKAKQVSKDQPKVSFTDVAGLENAIEELNEIKDFLEHPDKYRALGAKIPKGVLLFGPPGTGKTLLARAVAGEAGVPFFSISGSDFVEMFVGVGASRVRDLFEQAKQSAPAIVFIDEIDAVGRHRGAGVGGGHDEREQTLNQLLVELDGFEGSSGVIVMAATNRPDILDPALLRPGRFDRQVTIDAPDIVGRTAILGVHAKGKPLEPEIDLEVLARRTPGFHRCRSRQPHQRGCASHGAAPQDQGRDGRARGGDRSSDCRPGARVACHHRRREEAHRLPRDRSCSGRVSRFQTPTRSTRSRSVARGRSLGHTLALPTHDKFLVRRSELVDQLAMLLGGRTAEEIIFADPTTGAANDIEKATSIARRMVMEYGMSDKLGPLQYGKPAGEVFLGRDYTKGQDLSDEVASMVDEEVRLLVAAAHQEAREILDTHRDAMERMVASLLDQETLDREEIAATFHDVPKWEHTSSGSLRIQLPSAGDTSRSDDGYAAVSEV